MCLIVLAWLSHPRYRLVVAANRDEFHGRPTAPMSWWADGGRVLAGRDLAAGGTWLGLTRSGRFGAVTNFRDADNPVPDGAPSRGTLVPAFLAGDADAATYVLNVGGAAARYAGFNLLVGGPRELHYLCNRVDTRPRGLDPGIYGLSNDRLDTPWPKLRRAKERFADALVRGEPDPATLFDLLADRQTAHEPGSAPPGLPPDLAEAVSAAFVLHPTYGTRCSTVVLVAHDGRTIVFERRFDSAGRQTGATRIEFAREDPDE
jgi:uncharacterized protein with NRDE domain